MPGAQYAAADIQVNAKSNLLWPLLDEKGVGAGGMRNAERRIRNIFTVNRQGFHLRNENIPHYLKASSPVTSWPVMSKWISCVPS